MKKYTLAFLTTVMVLVSSLLTQKAYASHSAGGELTYAWLSDSTYRFTFKFYRDCSSTTTAPTVPGLNLCYRNDCGVTNQSIAFTTQAGPFRASTTCTQNKCDNPNSTIPGYEEYVYTVNVQLPSRCNAWHFFVYHNARNQVQNLSTTAPPNTLNSTGTDFAVETTLNNVAVQNNSSPVFSVKPVPFVCIGRPYNYNNGVTDINNDSLSFEMVMPLQHTGDCSSVPSPMYFYGPNALIGQTYDLATNPIPTNNTFSVNSQTGQLSFTPDLGPNPIPAPPAYGIALRVNEWRSGVKIGSVVRDIQVLYRDNCPNSPDPTFDKDPATSTGVNFTSTRVEACVNKPLVLCVYGNSTDQNEQLKIESNNATSAPGSSFATGGSGYHVTGCLSWTPTINDTGLHVITYTVTDTNCSTNGGIPRPQTFSVALYINPVTTASPDVSICAGTPTPLRVVGGGDWLWSVLPGGSPITSLSCTNCQNPIATPDQTTTYVVTARTSNSFCNVNTDTVKVTITTAAHVQLGPDIVSCVNNAVQLNATVDTAGQNSHTVFSFNWTPGTYLSNTNTANPVANASADISYIVQAIPNGNANCATYDTLKLTVLQGFTFDNVDTQVCKGASVQVRYYGDDRYNYRWSPGNGIPDITVPNAVITPDTSHLYTLTAAYPGCRDSVKSFYIDVQPIPVVYAGVDQIICYGDTVHIDESLVQPAAYPHYTYSWAPAGAFNDPTRLHPIYTGYETGSTYLTVTTPAGCMGMDSAKYTVVPANFLVVSADTAVCPGDSAQLHVSGDFRTLNWSTQTYISDTLSPDPYVYPITTSTYTVIARDSNYCLDTASVVVVVRPGALISLPDTVTIFPGESYQMNPGGNGLYFTWSPQGGLSNPNIANPIALPSTNTRYKVTAVTEAGCSVSDSIDVDVSLDSYIDVPNAFTPGSGPNSVLKIVHRGNVTVNTFKIYNRWGAQMFSTNDVNEGWNGQLNGQPQPMGVYVYVVDATTPTGRHFYKQGNVTLIR